MTIVHIQPTHVVPPPVLVTNFRYNVIEFEIFKKIVFRCSLCDANERVVDVRDVEISGQDYANWSADDTYLLHHLCKRLELPQLAPFNKPLNLYRQNAVDTSGNHIAFYYLMFDIHNNMILPPGFSREPTTNALLNELGRHPSFQYLAYNVDGIPFVYNPLTFDTNCQLVLPDGYITDKNGCVRDAQGIHIVIV